MSQAEHYVDIRTNNFAKTLALARAITLRTVMATVALGTLSACNTSETTTITPTVTPNQLTPTPTKCNIEITPNAYADIAEKHGLLNLEGQWSPLNNAGGTNGDLFSPEPGCEPKLSAPHANDGDSIIVILHKKADGSDPIHDLYALIVGKTGYTTALGDSLTQLGLNTNDYTVSGVAVFPTKNEYSGDPNFIPGSVGLYPQDSDGNLTGSPTQWKPGLNEPLQSNSPTTEGVPSITINVTLPGETQTRITFPLRRES